MKRTHFWLMLVLIVTSLQASACGARPTKADKIDPVRLELMEETGLKRVILTEKASQRLDIQTQPVNERQVNGSPRKIVPYSAVLYDLKGDTWAYTSTTPLTFLRQSIVIESLDGDVAVLSNGPDVGTPVVIVGAALLYGAELGVSK